MKKLDILIIDDDAANKREILKSISKNIFTNEILIFEDGEEALLQLDQKGKALDQVLIFLGMPVFSDRWFLDKLQNKDYQHKVKVLIMSASPALDKQKKLIQYSQVIGFLEKQLAPAIIMEIVDFFDNNLVIPCLGRKANSGFSLMVD